MAFTPYLMRRGECFAVTVPESALGDPYLRGLKKRYELIVSLVTIALTAVSLVFTMAGRQDITLLFVAAGTLLVSLGGYVLMLYFRNRVMTYKKQQQWTAQHQEAVTLGGEGTIPQAMSLKWNVLCIPVIVITLAVGLIGYAAMPDMIPRQVGADGQVTTWMEKSPFVVLFPVLIQLFMIAAFVFSHWSIKFSKKAVNPISPATSALVYGMFAHAQSMFTLTAGMTISLLLISMPLSFMNVISLAQVGLGIMIAAIVIVVGALALSAVYGQGGARLFRRMRESDTLAVDDDRYWKLGVFYFNREDPSIFLLERFGIGWTVN